MKTKRNIILLILGYLVAAIFFSLVNPERLALIFILVPFLILFLLIYFTCLLILDVFFEFPTRQKRIVAIVVGIMPVLMLIIQSITQLTVRDVLLCISITVILIWYSLKANAVS